MGVVLRICILEGTHYNYIKRTMKLLLIFATTVALVGLVNCGSAPIYKRSPIDFGSLLGGCSGNCNQQKYNVGRALAISGAAVGAFGLATNNEGFQRVGGSALVGGIGLKSVAKLFGRK